MGKARNFSAREVVLALALVMALAFATGATGAVKRSVVSIVDGKKTKRKATVHKGGALKVRQSGVVRVEAAKEIPAKVSGNVGVTGSVDAKVTGPVQVAGTVDTNVTNEVRSKVSGEVATIPGGLEDAFAKSGTHLGLGWENLLEATGEQQVAISTLVLSGRGPVSDTAQEVLLEAMMRTSGDNGCTGPGTAGYVRHTIGRFLVKNQTTSGVMRFTDPPLLMPKGGDKVCVGFTVVTIPSGSATDVLATGYVLG